MIKSFFRPILIKRYSIRTNCSSNCNARCINLISEQTQALNSIAKQTNIITIITAVNFFGPLIVFGSFSVANLINTLIK